MRDPYRVHFSPLHILSIVSPKNTYIMRIQYAIDNFFTIPYSIIKIHDNFDRLCQLYIIHQKCVHRTHISIQSLNTTCCIIMKIIHTRSCECHRPDMWCMIVYLFNFRDSARVVTRVNDVSRTTHTTMFFKKQDTRYYIINIQIGVNIFDYDFILTHN